MSSLDNYLNSLESEDQKKQQLVSSISQAANTNPDEFASMVKLSKASQISVDAIPDYKEQAVQAKVLGDAAIPKLFNQNPATANWLSNVDNAKIAHDQIRELGLVEEAGRKVGFFASGVTSDLFGGGIEGMGHIINATWRRATSAAGKMLPTPMAGGQATEESLAGSDMPGEGFVATGKKITELSDQYIKPEGKMTKADQVAAGLGQATGQIGMMLMPGGAVAAPLMMFGQGAKAQKDKIDMDKLSLQAPQSDQDWEVLTGGAVTGATEWIASKLMIKTPAAFALRSKMLDYSAKIALGATEEGIQEFSENILQDAAHVAMTNPESTIKWNEAVESGEVGAWVGGILQGVINGALHIRARGQQKAFENLNDAAGAQRLREREPDAYQSFADATAQHLAQTSNGAVTDVYIDAATFKQTMLENKVDPDSVAAAIPSVSAQYNDALATGGDLVIPMNEWVGKVAGTDIGTMLSQHVRANADSLSMVETQQAYEMRADIQKAAEAAIEKNKANDEFIKSAKEVETTMLDQLKATGRYTDAVAKVNAQFVRDFVVTQAADMGISPKEFFDKYNYKVESGGQAAYTQQNLDQATQILSVTPEFKNWFKASKASDETGKPIVLYHSTDADVTEFNTKGGKGKTAGTGLFLTNKPNISGSYAPRRGGMTYPVYASLQNPLIVDFGGANWNQAGENAVVELQGGMQDRLLDYFNAGPDETVSTDDVARLARERGHDGVIIRNAVDQGPYNVVQGDNVGDIYVAFNPEQIKSVFNEGSWSPETANILKQSLSSRLPTAVKATEDPLGETLSINYDVTLSDTVTLAKNMAALMKTPNMRKLTGKGAKDPVRQAEEFIQHVVDNLLWLHDHMPAEMRDRADLWYDGGRKTTEVWANRYGISEMQGAATIAVLSPQNGWFANVSQAERIMDMVFGLRDYAWDDAMTTEAQRIVGEEALDDRMVAAQGKTLGELLATPDIAARWIRVYDQTYNNRAYRVLTPEGGAADYVKTNKGADATMMWKSYSTISKAVSILMDGRAENVYYQLGREHKVRNFYNNLFAPDSPLGFTTIDTHAVAAALLRPLAAADTEVLQAFGGAGSASSSVTGLNGTYPIYLEAYRRAAEARGILPRQMQSITWEAVRGLFEAAKKKSLKKDADAIWNRYKEGEIDQSQAQQEILALAGDITPPSWTEVPFNDTVSRTYEGPAQKIIDERGDVGPVASDEIPKVFFEVAPDPNDTVLTTQWNSLPEQEKSRISQSVAETIVPKILEEVGTGGQFTMQIGGYEGATNPSMTLQVERPELAITAAKLLGFALSQDSMMVVAEKQAVGMDPVGSISIDLPDGYGEQQVRELYDRLWELEQDGNKLVGGHTTVDGHMVILNYSGLDNNALALIIDQHLGGEFTVRENTVYSAFPSKEDYNYAGDIESTPARGAPAETRARNLRAEATELLRSELRGRGVFNQSGIGSSGRIRAGDQTVRSSYGTARDGSSSVVGIHYSRQSRDSLSGDFYTTGLKGAEFGRLQQSFDDRLRKRIHFYVDTGAGVKPESGVGAYAHAIQLNNLYNTDEDPLGLLKTARASGQMYWFNDFESAVIDAGFDGVYVPKAQGDQGVAVLLGEHNNVAVDQLGNNALRQNDIFYSALQRAFENVKQGSMPADQWLKWLSSNQAKLGVKKEEIEATGLREYLELNGKDKLTKEQVTAFLSSNGVQIQEVMKGGTPQIDFSEVEELPVPSPLKVVENDDDRLQQYKYAVKTVMDGRYIGYGNTEQDALSDAYSGYPEYWEDMNEVEAPKYAQWVLPGGENYKELLLTLPTNNAKIETEMSSINDRRIALRREYGDNMPADVAAEYSELSVKLMQLDAEKKKEFVSSHWDEANILAHIRFNERTDADGKRVLFIEELQSDWAQAGRKKGFRGNGEVPAGYSIIDDAEEARKNGLAVPEGETGPWYFKGPDSTSKMYKTREEAVVAANRDAGLSGEGVTPSAPFVKDTKAWVGLSIKRMIRYAAENGFDKVAFVNGKQSADRYDLSKSVKQVEVYKLESGLYNLEIVGNDGRIVSVPDSRAISAEKIAEIVGKDVAEKAVEQADKTGESVLTGVDLQVGGEGMKAFYDKIVPQVANDVLKKLGGGKVEPIMTIQSSEYKDQSIRQDGNEWVAIDRTATNEEVGRFATREAAEKFMGFKPSQQLGFTITPAMRDSVMAGQALFQKENEGDARGGFDPSRLTTILNEKTDYSTFLHETAHFFLTVYSDMAAQPNATARSKADMQTLLDWFGVQDLATWNAMSLEEQRKYHEQFAYNYELYLFEGKAPSVKMQSLFDRFTAWLKRVYKSIREDLNAIYRQEHGEDLPILTGEVREVMDRMLASDEQIKQAEQVRSMAPIYQTQEQSGMDDGAWAAYQEMVKEAQTESINDLTKASLRQMKWLENARSRVIKDIQRTTRETRKKVMAEVTEEVNNLPMFKAQEALKAAENEAEQAAVIDAFGFSSVEELKLVLKNSKNKREIIRERTDKRMLEEYGDLTDPKQIEIAIERALHTEARARFVAVELRHLAKAMQPVRVMLEAARQAARSIISSKPVGSIREKDFSASEARSARQAMEALRRGDSEGAIKAKQSQLLNNQLTAEALSAKAEVAKAMELFKKVFRKDEKLAKGRDMNLVSAARAILANYGLGNTDMGAAYYLEKVKAYDPEFYAEIEPMITAHKQAGKPVTDLTMDEFRDLAEQVEALWIMSRNSKTVEIDGKRMDREDVVNELVAAMPTTGKPRLGYDKAMSDWDKRKIMLMGARAALRRVESWVDAMDGGKMEGPFRKYIWTPISEAVAKYRLAKVDYLKKYLDIVKTVEKGLTGEPIVAPEIGYTFKNKAELLHAIIHTGNNSNKRKLLLGREWASVDENDNMDTSQWDSFIARMVTEGKLTKADYDFAQKVWDLLEEMKPAAQKAHKEMYGFYFAEITADRFDTPFGSYRGGYAPAVTDPWINTEASVRNEQETQQTDNSYMFPTTGRGFTKGRVEYNKPLILDLGFLPSHLDKVLRFTFIEPRVKDVAKIVKTNKAFASAMDQLDPTIRGDMLVPWLQRTAQQMIQMPMKGMGGKLAHKFFSEVRNRTGMQMMVANFTNAIQQITGISIAGLKVKPSYLRDATWLYVRQPTAMSDMISEKSEYMRGRMSNSQFEVAKSIDELLLNPSKYEKLRDFAGKHGYFMQQGMQNLVDTIVWTGAYNQAMAADPDEKAAVRAADSAVRLTQGSFSPEDQSRFESGNAFVRAFTMFYSYFNMQSNLLGTEFTKIVREFGVKKGMGKLLYVYVLGFMIPAVMSEMIVQAAGGFDDGDDDEYDMFDAMALFFGAQARAGLAMAPVVGPAVTAGVNMFNSKPYDDRISTSPSISAIEASVRAPASVYNAIVEDKSWKKAVRDVLTALGMITGLPLGQLAKPAGYAADVAQGNANPESALDVVRGLVSGKDVNRKD